MSQIMDFPRTAERQKKQERSEAIRITLTPSETKVFALIEKELIKLYNEKGYVYNRNEHLRSFLLNCNKDLLFQSTFQYFAETKPYHLKNK